MTPLRDVSAPERHPLSASQRFAIRTGLLLVASLLELPGLSEGDRDLCICELRDIIALLEVKS